MIRARHTTKSRRSMLSLEHLEERTVLACTSPDPFICTPLAAGHDGLGLHIHANLSIFADGVKQTIPADIGIINGQMLPVHTHDGSGRMHLESPIRRDFKLRDFFDVQDETFSATQVLNFRGTVAMTANGQPNTQLGNLVLTDEMNIEIRVTTAPTKPGALQFSASTYTVAANAGSTTVTVTRANGSDGAVQVNYATSNGTGIAGVDYQSASGELSFAQGETSKTYTVSILNSNSFDAKTVNLTLSNPTGGATLGTPAASTITITSTRPPIDPAANQAYIGQVYRDLFKREADAEGIRIWAGALNSGVSNTDVLLGLTSTQECYQKIVQNMYQKYLGRAADPAGLNGFTAALQAGSTVEQLKAVMCASDEYFQKYGGSTAGFLDNLYRHSLDREIDPAARTGLLQQLANQTDRVIIAQTVLQSQEYREKLAQSLYREYFGRGADPAGLAYWTDALRVGTREQHVRTGFLTSTEYVGRHQRRLN